MKQSRSLRQWSLIITGAGAGIALATLLISEIINRVHYSGALIGLGWVLIGGCLLTAGGLVTLLVDGVLRLTGRRL